MSFQIETKELVEAPPLFEVPTKEIVKPDTNRINSRVRMLHPQMRRSAEDSQTSQMDLFYGRLIAKEKELAYLQSSVKILNNYQKIRQNWIRSSQSMHATQSVKKKFNVNSNALDNFLNENPAKRDRIDMREIMRNMPKKVDLECKYNSKVMVKYGSIYEAMEIANSKKQFNRLRDETLNDSRKSPMYLQMAKAIQFLPRTPATSKKGPPKMKMIPNQSYSSRKKAEMLISAKHSSVQSLFTNKRLVAEI